MKNIGRILISSLLAFILTTAPVLAPLSEAQAAEVKKESSASVSANAQEVKTETTESGEVSENDIEEAVEEAVVSENETGTASEEISDGALGAVMGDDYLYKSYGPVDEYNTWGGGYYNTETWGDDWGFIKRQCTSFVAWRITRTNGLTGFNNWYAGYTWGNASTWGNAAAGLGILNNTPAVGAVAWDGSHVAWVAEVGNGTVTIEEYNCNCPESGYRWLCYSCRTVSTGAYQYIHFKDINPTINHTPRGYLDSWGAGNNEIGLNGWAIDDDNPSAQLAIHVYVGDYARSGSTAEVHTFKANKYRSDGGIGYHGFSEKIKVNKTGKQPIYVYAIDSNANDNPCLNWNDGKGTVVNITTKPRGHLDSYGAGYNEIGLNGWAIDDDTPSTPVTIHVYVGDYARTGSTAEVHTFKANKYRSDGGIGYHGFSEKIKVTKTGKQRIYVYALDTSINDNPCLNWNDGKGTEVNILKRISVEKVSLNKPNMTLAVGKTESLTATIAPSNATNKAVTWISSNPNVASVDSKGIVTGKGAGTAAITVKTAEGGKTATCKVDVGTAPVITTNSLPEAVYDKDYSAKIQASGTAPITFTITSGSLPGGFTLSDGTITGSPTGVCGVSTFTVQAKNAYGTSEKKLSMEVVSAAKILHQDGEELMEGTVGEWYKYGVSRQGNGYVTGDGYICSIINGSLPDGLSFDNGTITGTPTRAGKYVFTVKVENKYGNDTKQLSITIKASDGSESEPVPVPDEGSDTVIVAGQKIKLKDVCFDEYDGKIARYKVDDKNLASVSKGMLTGKKAGTVKVIAQVSVGKNKYEDVAECNVTILSRPKLKFSAPLTYDGQTINAPDFFTTEDTASLGATSWESSNPKVVDVTDEEAGTLQAHKNGSAKITAYFGEKGKAGTLKVTATLYVKKPAFSKKEYTVLTGGKLTLSMKNVSAAMNPEWKAEDESVIRVTPQTNKKGDVTGKVIVEGLSSGDTTLTATIDGQEYACEIHVPAPVISRSAMNLKQGKSFTLALKNTKLRKPEIDWYTSDPDVATVDTNGKVIAIGEGEAIIYTETGGVLNECTVRVK